MRNMLAFLMLVFLVLAGLGWYLDWFAVHTAPGTDGHTTLSIDVNTVKAYKDVSKAATKGAEMLDKKAKDEAAKAEAEKKAKAEAEKATAKDSPTKTGGWLD
jgi:hypothetical protein